MSGKRYEKISFLGEGQFATVYKARDKETNIEVAIKKIKIGDFTEARDGVNRTALREIKLLQELHHENVINLLDVYGKDSSISLVFNLMETDLEQILQERKIWLSLAHIKAYILMTLRGVEFLHQNFILHRDLKPNNLLLDRHNVLKIADFGLARTFGSPTRVYTNQVVTRWYRAPELLFGSRMYGAGIDIWAVGCILAELFKREALFPGDSDIDMLNRVMRLMGTPTDENWPGVSKLPDYVAFNDNYEKIPLSEHFSALEEDAIEILESLLCMDPNQRCDATQALAMRYFSSEPYPTPCESLPRIKEPEPEVKQEKKVQKIKVKLELNHPEGEDFRESDESVRSKPRFKVEPSEAALEVKATKAKRLKFE